MAGNPASCSSTPPLAPPPPGPKRARRLDDESDESGEQEEAAAAANIIDLLEARCSELLCLVIHLLDGEDLRAFRQVKKSWRDKLATMWRSPMDRNIFQRRPWFRAHRWKYADVALETAWTVNSKDSFVIDTHHIFVSAPAQQQTHIYERKSLRLLHSLHDTICSDSASNDEIILLKSTRRAAIPPQSWLVAIEKRSMKPIPILRNTKFGSEEMLIRNICGISIIGNEVLVGCVLQVDQYGYDGTFTILTLDILRQPLRLQMKYHNSVIGSTMKDEVSAGTRPHWKSFSRREPGDRKRPLPKIKCQKVDFVLTFLGEMEFWWRNLSLGFHFVLASTFDYHHPLFIAQTSSVEARVWLFGADAVTNIQHIEVDTEKKITGIVFDSEILVLTLTSWRRHSDRECEFHLYSLRDLLRCSAVGGGAAPRPFRTVTIRGTARVLTVRRNSILYKEHGLCGGVQHYSVVPSRNTGHFYPSHPQCDDAVKTLNF